MKEFVVPTARLKTTMAEQKNESRSLRQMECNMLKTTGSFKNYN